MTASPASPRHPVQPLVLDVHGVLRYKENAIVSHLLEAGPFDMNSLAVLPFSQEDREQFAQLIGYSHSGSGDLSYFSDEAWEMAAAAHEDPENVLAKEQHLRAELDALRDALREPIARLFGIHPEDLGRHSGVG